MGDDSINMEMELKRKTCYDEPQGNVKLSPRDMGFSRPCF